MSAITLRSVRKSRIASSAPTPAEGSVERIVIGVDVALVEHAEHDVHDDERGQDQQRLRGERGLEGLGGSLEAGVDVGRQADLPLRRLDVLDRVSERRARREVEGERDRGELALVVDGERGRARLVARERRERHERARARAHVDVAQGRRRLLELRAHLEHDAVLVEALVHRGDRPLPEGVVERLVDRLDRHAEARRRVAVHDHRRLQAAVLLVGVRVADLRDLRHLREQGLRPGRRGRRRAAPAACTGTASCVGRPPTRTSCTGWRNRLAPGTLASGPRSRAITRSALSWRSSSGFSWMNMRAVLRAPPPPNASTLSTAGSLRTIAT